MKDYRWLESARAYDWANKRVLLVGGTGFVGSRTLEVLTELGAKVYVISRGAHEDTAEVTYLQCDLNDMDSIKKYAGTYHYDVAVYLAARIPFFNGKAENYIEAKISTLDPFINFCTLLMDDADKLIYTSSVDAVGVCGIEDYDETVICQNQSPYGLAKYTGELYARAICEQAGKACTILRFAQVYGPKEPMIKIIPKLLATIDLQETFTLYTTGQERRRYVYLDDVVQSVIRAIMCECGGIYNIAGAEKISMNQLIDTVQQVCDATMKVDRLNKVQGTDNLPSIDRAIETLEYEPEVDMVAGLSMVRKLTDQR